MKRPAICWPFSFQLSAFALTFLLIKQQGVLAFIFSPSYLLPGLIAA
jgi:hypothetical protein